MKVRAKIPSPDNATNFNIVSKSETVVGTTLENLKAAIAGETGASAKYTAFAKAAKEQGYDQIARLFEATAAAEQIHIGLEYALVAEMEPGYEKPTVDAPTPGACDLNLISGANGEIYETSDMYPAFIKKAQEEGNNKAVMVFYAGKAGRVRFTPNAIWTPTTTLMPRTTTSSISAPSADISTREKTLRNVRSVSARKTASPDIRASYP